MARQDYEDALHQLDQQVLKMGILVIESLKKTVQGLCDNDTELFNQVRMEDMTINQLEFEIDDRCAVMIATEQPVAQDLRHLIAILKIVTQLERMGDHSAGVAKFGQLLENGLNLMPRDNIHKMTNIIVSMIDDILSAFLHADGERAVDICKLDDQVDELHYEIQHDVMESIHNGKCTADDGLKLMAISRYLERMADQVTNIAEWIVFEVKGEHQELNK